MKEEHKEKQVEHKKHKKSRDHSKHQHEKPKQEANTKLPEAVPPKHKKPEKNHSKKEAAKDVVMKDEAH